MEIILSKRGEKCQGRMKSVHLKKSVQQGKKVFSQVKKCPGKVQSVHQGKQASRRHDKCPGEVKKSLHAGWKVITWRKKCPGRRKSVQVRLKKCPAREKSVQPGKKVSRRDEVSNRIKSAQMYKSGNFRIF